MKAIYPNHLTYHSIELFNALPDEFCIVDAIDIAERFNIRANTVKHYKTRWLNGGLIETTKDPTAPKVRQEVCRKIVKNIELSDAAVVYGELMSFPIKSGLE